MNVFVFGAGISAPAGFPLGQELGTEVRSYVSDSEQEVWTALEGDGVFKGTADFELDLTRLDIRIIEEMRRDPGRVVVPIRVGGNERDLITFRNIAISQALSALMLLQQSEAMAACGRLDYLRRFVSRHVRRGDVVVTFNYDCLAETILHEQGLWTLRTGYGINLLETYPTLAAEPDSPCLVLKLHGSAEWFSAVMKKELLLSLMVLKEIGYPDLERRKPYETIGVGHSAVIPSYVKSLSRYPLPELWCLASKALREAEKVAIIGYSFPNADSAARVLCITSFHAGQRATYFWHSGADRRPGAIRELLSVSGADARDEKSSIQALADEPTLWK